MRVCFENTSTSKVLSSGDRYSRYLLFNKRKPPFVRQLADQDDFSLCFNGGDLDFRVGLAVALFSPFALFGLEFEHHQLFPFAVLEKFAFYFDAFHERRANS